MDNKKKNIWGIIIQTLITILTAIGTSLGVTSCSYEIENGKLKIENYGAAWIVFHFQFSILNSQFI